MWILVLKLLNCAVQLQVTKSLNSDNIDNLCLCHLKCDNYKTYKLFMDNRT